MVQAQQILENTMIYTWLYHKFYKPSLNTYKIYKLYEAETKVRIEDEGLHLPQVYTEKSPN